MTRGTRLKARLAIHQLEFTVEGDVAPVVRPPAIARAAAREASRAEGRRQRARAAGRHERELQRFAPVLRALAEARAPQPVTLDDLHAELVRRGWITGRESGRALSYWGALPRRAKLVRVGQVLSTRKRGHNEIAAWTIPAATPEARSA